MVGDYKGSFSSDDSNVASLMDKETTSSTYSAGKDSISTEWTDEKHSMYLKSMETSFVDQLYNSLGAVSSNLTDIETPRRFSSSRKPSEEQFKVLRDGFWQKMNLKRPEFRFNGRHGGSHEFLRSPWIKHYRPLPRTQNLAMDEPGIQVVSSGSASSLQISVEEEVSDQNFVNEVSKSENGSSKKMKTVMSASSSNDQVVPIRKASAT